MPPPQGEPTPAGNNTTPLLLNVSKETGENCNDLKFYNPHFPTIQHYTTSGALSES
jgi:hypothetical protein